MNIIFLFVLIGQESEYLSLARGHNLGLGHTAQDVWPVVTFLLYACVAYSRDLILVVIGNIA